MPARNVYSTRFLQRQNLSGVAVYVVPAGMVAVVRDADVYDGSTGKFNEFQLAIERADGSNLTVIDDFISDLTTFVHAWRGRQVLFEGDALEATSAVGYDVTVSGYLLTAP